MRKLPSFHFDTVNNSKNVVLAPGRVFFLFNIGGPLHVSFNIHYKRQLDTDQFQIIFHPDKAYDINFSSNDDTQENLHAMFVTLGIEELHELLTEDASVSNLFDRDFNKPYHYEQTINIEIRSIIKQILANKTAHPTANLFLNAKLLELLSLIFAPKEEINYQLCPFLKDNRNVEIIKKAKTILVQNLSENITIEKLSRAVGMNEHNLKLGFKEIYGSTVHQFINNYKLIEAKNQLLSGNYRIQEIAENFGYKNTSHFIGSFKKKFGQTPKQYLIKS